MAMVEINWNPSRKELRQFGLLCLAFFGGIAALKAYHAGVTTAVEVLGVAALVGGVLGMAAPQLLKWIYVGWMVAVFPIGWTISHILLGFIFYGVLTPMGLIIRALGHDPMNRTLDRNATTYWSPHESAPVSRYFRQF